MSDLRLTALLLLTALDASHAWGAGPQAAGEVDACKLLPRSRIVEVQGSAPISMRSTSHDDGRLTSSHCYFSLSPSHQSVSLDLMWQSARDSQNVREFWQRRFHGKQEEAAEAGEPHRPARAITGAGEEAFWAYTGYGGILYVLQGTYILRIAIGGHGDEQAMTERALKLARSALTELSALH